MPDQKKQWKTFEEVYHGLQYTRPLVLNVIEMYNEFVSQVLKSFLSDANVSFGWVQYKQHHKEICLGSGIGSFGLTVWQNSF